MSNIDPYEPAFPETREGGRGLTILAWLAGQALASMTVALAKRAVRIAELTISELNKQQP